PETSSSEGTRARPLAGTWVPQKAEAGGREFPVSEFDGAVLKLTADSYDFGGDKGTYTLPPHGDPRQMDILCESGPNGGRTIQAIYTPGADPLVSCYQLGKGERPTKSEPPAGSGVLLVHYRRKP